MVEEHVRRSTVHSQSQVARNPENTIFGARRLSGVTAEPLVHADIEHSDRGHSGGPREELTEEDSATILWNRENS